MKIALCFSGQPRFIEQVAPYVKENIIGDYDVDVFAHLWFDEDLQTKPYKYGGCLLYTSPSPRDKRQSRMPSSA